VDRTGRPLSRYQRKRLARLEAPPPEGCAYGGCGAVAGGARVTWSGAGVRLDAGLCPHHEGAMYKHLKRAIGIVHFEEAA
jgi:hypothetical protein